MQSTYLIASVNLVLFSVSVINTQKSNYLCKKFLQAPNFDVDLIVGKPWRIYYTWVMDYGERCIQTTFKKLNRTSKIRNTFANNMDIYMKDKIVWEDASLLVSKFPVVFKEGELTKEMLFFSKGHDLGIFDGIHDFTAKLSRVPRHSLKAMRFVLKLFREGKFLVMADCSRGVSVLMTRPDETFYRSEILSLASEIWDEMGFETCTSHKNINEIEPVVEYYKVVPN